MILEEAESGPRNVLKTEWISQLNHLDQQQGKKAVQQWSLLCQFLDPNQMFLQKPGGTNVL